MPARHRWLLSLLLLVVTLPALSVSAGKFNKVLSVGDPAPEWKDLIGVDGRRHSLSDLKEAKVVVIVFTCNHCPVAKAYEDRLIESAKEWRPQGVELVAISVSRLEADNLEAMRKRAADRSYPFLYLQDLTQNSGRSYGAWCTPHVFVLDQKRIIASMGRIDDNLHADKVTEPFLKNAVAAVLQGQQPDPVETKPVGCLIEYVED